MNRIAIYLVVLLAIFSVHQIVGQEGYKARIEQLNAQKVKITDQEKKALKTEVSEINKRLEDGSISSDTAAELKETAAKKRALNIENRIAIINNKIALLDRNEGVVLQHEK